MNFPISRDHPRIASSAVVAVAIAAALVTWSLVQLAGIDLEVGRNGDMSTVGAVDVVIATLVGGLAAWAVHAFMASRGSMVRWWPFVGSTALAISMIGPSWFADGESAMALMIMHFVVGIVLIAGLSMVQRDTC